MDVQPATDTVARTQRAATYARRSRALWFLALGLKVLMILVVLGSGFAVWWRAQIEQITDTAVLVVGIYLATLGVLYWLLLLPQTIVLGLILPRRYGLVNQTNRAWASDLLKGLILDWPLQLILIEGLYLFLRWLPTAWPIMAGLSMIGLSLVFAWLIPMVINPLVNTYTPLADSALHERLLGVIRASGATIQSLVVEDSSRRTSTANAYVTGIGSAQQVVLGDTLVKSFTPDEIETVMAHELSHYIRRDIWRKLALNGAVVSASYWLMDWILRAGVPAFGLRDKADIAGLLLFSLGLTSVGLLLQPLTNAYSRRREQAADRYALALTNKPESFIGAMRKLEYQNLAEHDPPGWAVILFYTHPPIAQRIAAAAAYSHGEGHPPIA